MKRTVTLVVHLLLSAARDRAMLALRKQAEFDQPLDYRLNAGGWN